LRQHLAFNAIRCMVDGKAAAVAKRRGQVFSQTRLIFDNQNAHWIPFPNSLIPTG
jgi:hypothetical protein